MTSLRLRRIIISRRGANAASVAATAASVAASASAVVAKDQNRALA